MTALSLSEILAEELGRVGLTADPEKREAVRRTVFLSALPGYALRTYWSGRRVYIVQHRMGGRMRTVTIGNAAVLSEATARSVAYGVLLRCQTGDDPAATRARVRSAPTYAAFLEDYWRRMSPQWKPRTQETQDSYRRNHLDGAFAGKFIDEIETADVARWFARITDNSGPGAANRCLDILSAAMHRAEEWGYRLEGDNPCAGVHANRRRKCERFLSDQELARLGEALKAAEPMQPVHAAAVKLLAMTGCRVSEIVLLRWGEVRGQRLLLTDSKTGARTVWLGSRARGVLDAFRRGKPEGFVFPFDNPHRGVLNSFWKHVRDGAGLPGVRLHDLRHSFASFAARRSESLPMIGKLLGHAKIASTARYAHLDDACLIEASERVGGQLERFAGEAPFLREASAYLVHKPRFVP